MVVSRKRISSRAGILASSQSTLDHHPGPVLLHLDRGDERVERTGFHEPGHGVADDLAGQVVEVGLEHPDPVAGGRQLDGADEEPEDVGLLGQVAGAGAQTDAIRWSGPAAE